HERCVEGGQSPGEEHSLGSDNGANIVAFIGLRTLSSPTGRLAAVRNSNQRVYPVFIKNHQASRFFTVVERSDGVLRVRSPSVRKQKP
ncbi:MAG: hypothetical protein AAF436_20770, partial [Myxococcota bacterium]